MTKRVFGEQPESTTHFVAFVHRDRQTSLPRRPSIWWYFRTTRFRYVLAAPAIYGMAIPLLLLDVSATVYQYVCSVVYGIPWVRRSD